MKRLLIISVMLFISIFSFGQNHYPSSPIVPVTDTYFGTSVTDNYRWLEANYQEDKNTALYGIQ